MLIVPPPFCLQLFVGLRESGLSLGEARSAVQIHSREVRAHLENVEHAAVVERLIVDADVVGFVQVHADAHLAQGRIGLRGPGAAGLTVGNRSDAEDPADIASALRFATVELGPAVLPPGVLQVHRDRRLLAVCVRVVADVVTLERRDHVASAALFEHAGLLANDLERGPHTQPRQHLRQALRRIVIRGQDVVLGVEPEHDVDGWVGVLARRPTDAREYHEQREQRLGDGFHSVRPGWSEVAPRSLFTEVFV